MVIVLKKGADKSTIEEIFNRVNVYKPKPGLDSFKYCGKVKFKKMA